MKKKSKNFVANWWRKKRWPPLFCLTRQKYFTCYSQFLPILMFLGLNTDFTNYFQIIRLSYVFRKIFNGKNRDFLCLSLLFDWINYLKIHAFIVHCFLLHWCNFVCLTLRGEGTFDIRNSSWEQHRFLFQLSQGTNNVWRNVKCEWVQFSNNVSINKVSQFNGCILCQSAVCDIEQNECMFVIF